MHIIRAIGIVNAVSTCMERKPVIAKPQQAEAFTFAGLMETALQLVDSKVTSLETKGEPEQLSSQTGVGAKNAERRNKCLSKLSW